MVMNANQSVFPLFNQDQREDPLVIYFLGRLFHYTDRGPIAAIFSDWFKLPKELFTATSVLEHTIKCDAHYYYLRTAGRLRNQGKSDWFYKQDEHFNDEQAKVVTMILNNVPDALVSIPGHLFVIEAKFNRNENINKVHEQLKRQIIATRIAGHFYRNQTGNELKIHYGLLDDKIDNSAHELKLDDKKLQLKVKKKIVSHDLSTFPSVLRNGQIATDLFEKTTIQQRTWISLSALVKETDSEFQRFHEHLIKICAR